MARSMLVLRAVIQNGGGVMFYEALHQKGSYLGSTSSALTRSTQQRLAEHFISGFMVSTSFDEMKVKQMESDFMPSVTFV